MKTALALLGGVLLAGLVAGAGVVYLGLYNVAADVPHWEITTRVLQTVRERSVERRAEAVEVPDLRDQQLVLKGAGQYAAMCVNCHLAPGLPENQLSRGLYPSPPRLDQHELDPRKAFIVIKHGLKMTGMPAWGGDHGDEAVWSLVAFAMALPGMDAERYRELVRRAPPDEEMHGTAAAPGGNMNASGDKAAHGRGNDAGQHSQQNPAGQPSAPAARSGSASSAPVPDGSPGQHGD